MTDGPDPPDDADELDDPDEVAAVPAAMAGAWRRTDLVVGGEGRDDADVLWLQAGDWYADLRIPHRDDGGPIEAFAGPATWDPPEFTWVHDLDWLGSFPVDVGRLEWQGPDLVETGVFGDGPHAVAYRELWVRQPEVVPMVAAVGFDADRRCIVVQAGAHRLSLAGPASVPTTGVRPMAIRRDDFDGRAWSTRIARAVGCDPAPMPELSDADGPLGLGSVVGAVGWELEVVSSTEVFATHSNWADDPSFESSSKVDRFRPDF